MDINRMDDVIEQNAARMTGRLGVYFQDLTAGGQASYHAEEAFPSASVFKDLYSQ